MAVVRRPVERRASEVVLAVDIRAAAQVPLDGLDVAVCGVIGERTKLDGGLAAVTAEDGGRVLVRQLQRGQPGGVLGVHGRAVGDEQVDRLPVSAPGGAVQRGQAFRVFFVDRRAVGKEQGDNGPVPARG